MSYFTDHGNSVTASQQEGEKAQGAEPLGLSPGRLVSFIGHEEYTPALTYAFTLGPPFDPALQQDYVPRQGSPSPFQHQPILPNNPGPDQPPRFVCLMPGCPTTCSRVNDLDRHYKAQHQSPGLKPDFKCHVEGCNRKEIAFNRKDKLREHLRNIHYMV